MDERATHLSRTIAYALRHRPNDFSLTLDASGSVAIEEMIKALIRHDEMWRDVTADEIRKAISIGPKRRFEIDQGSIRALYGHSVENRIEMVPECPPDVLFHGTNGKAWVKIRQHGLISMRRQYVHLSPDVETATKVAGRRTDKPVILKVNTAQATASGCKFYRRNEHVWLSGTIGPSFLTICDMTDH